MPKRARKGLRGGEPGRASVLGGSNPPVPTNILTRRPRAPQLEAQRRSRGAPGKACEGGEPRRASALGGSNPPVPTDIPTRRPRAPQLEAQRRSRRALGGSNPPFPTDIPTRRPRAPQIEAQRRRSRSAPEKACEGVSPAGRTCSAVQIRPSRPIIFKHINSASDFPVYNGVGNFVYGYNLSVQQEEYRGSFPYRKTSGRNISGIARGGTDRR